MVNSSFTLSAAFNGTNFCPSYPSTSNTSLLTLAAEWLWNGTYLFFPSAFPWWHWAFSPVPWPFELLLLLSFHINCSYFSEKEMAPHSSTLAWKIPWTEEPGGLQSVGLLGVEHDWATSLSFFTFMVWRRNGNPLPCSCLENPRDGGGGSWWAAIYGVAQSRTQLKWLSSSSRDKVYVYMFFNKV